MEREELLSRQAGLLSLQRQLQDQELHDLKHEVEGLHR
jgi:hypothetical protein